MSQMKATQIAKDTLSSSKNAILTTNYANDYIIRGYGFSLEDTADITSGNSLFFTLDVTENPEKNIIFLPLDVCTSVEDIEVIIYEDTDYSGGVALTPYNLNRKKSDIVNTILKGGATGSSKGTQIKKKYGTSDKKAGGRISEGTLTILDTDKKYLVEIKNLGATTTTICYSVVFYEY